VDIPPLADAAIEVGAKVLWMQLGIVNEEAAAKAGDAGIEVIMNRCMKIEFARMFGGLSFIGVNTKIISAKRPMWLPY
jgi:predicted CoA-binding protein